VTATKDFLQKPHLQFFGRKHDQVEGHQGPSTHGIDVRERICRCNLPKPIGIINRGRDIVHCTDKSSIRRKTIDGCIIARLKTDEQIGILGTFQGFKGFRQNCRTNFRSSTAGAGKARQRLFLLEEGQLFLQL
jgi:hypothetical protein